MNNPIIADVSTVVGAPTVVGALTTTTTSGLAAGAPLVRPGTATASRGSR